MVASQASKLIDGNKLYHVRARKAFPLLVRQAWAGKPIYYSDLAEELGMPNARNLNYVLGCIGNAIIELSRKKLKGNKIPPIQCLVINKTTKLPGSGFDAFLTKVGSTTKDFKNLDKASKRRIVSQHLNEIYLYSGWAEVLSSLSLDQPSFPDQLPITTSIFSAGGEGEEHKKLKKFVAKNPCVVGLSKKWPEGNIEEKLESGDSVDVMFSFGDEYVAVEVKSIISNINDINRGLYQCIKYQAVLEAMLGVKGKPKNVRAVLVLGGDFPKELLSTKNILGIEVLSNIVD